MKGTIKLYVLIIFSIAGIQLQAQTIKPVYHPCFLMDSADARLDFIKDNASKIFIDSFDCKATLLDSIAVLYVRSKDKKYLDALNTILLNPHAKVDGLYTDIIKRFTDDDLGDFMNQLYMARGKYQALEKELIAMMNMIVDNRPYKIKYIGQINVEISKAKDKKDTYKASYLEKLKTKIEEEKY
jgi:hypothetical protein